MADKWLQKEVELNEKHEEILARREALLRQAELRLGDIQDLSASVAHHWSQAKQRNQDFVEEIVQCQTDAKIQAARPPSVTLTTLKEIVQCQTDAKIQAARPPSVTLTTLKERYWDLVEKEMPEWKQEVKKAKKDRSNPPSAR